MQQLMCNIKRFYSPEILYCMPATHRRIC